MIKRIDFRTNSFNQNNKNNPHNVTFKGAYKIVGDVHDNFLKIKYAHLKTSDSLSKTPTESIYDKISNLKKKSVLTFFQRILKPQKSYNKAKDLGDCWSELVKRGIKEVKVQGKKSQIKTENTLENAFFQYDNCQDLAIKLKENDILNAQIKNVETNFYSLWDNGLQ